MSEVSNNASEQLRAAVMQQPVWEEVAEGHFDLETYGITGYPDKYVSVSGGSVPGNVLPAETQARLGYDEESADLVKLSLGRKLEGNGASAWQAEDGENALALRLSRAGNPLDGSGKWMHLDYLLSVSAVSDRPEVPPVTRIETHVHDSTEEMRLMHGMNRGNDSFLANIYEKAPVDPGTDEPDPELLVKGTGSEESFDLLTGSPDDAQTAKTEHTVNQSMAEFNASMPLAEAEVLALAGLVRSTEAYRDL